MEEKEYKVGKDIIKTSLKVLLALVLAVVFVAIGLFVITPKTTAKICSALGFKHLEVSCLELEYSRTKNNTDLYNLIVKVGGIKNYNKQQNYIKILQKDTEYSEFCTKFDESMIASYKSGKISAKELASLYGVGEYLSSTYSNNYLLTNKLDDAYSAIVSTTLDVSDYKDKDFELAVYYYIDYLYSKGVSAETCSTYINKLVNENNILDYLQSKEVADSAQISATEKSTRILAKYQQVKITYARYIIFEVTENAGTEGARTNWQNAIMAYANEIQQT